MAAPFQKELPVIWVGAEELPVQFANAFVGLIQPGEIFLTVGSVLPPVVGGSEEERRAQLDATQFIHAKPVARLALTPRRLDELIAMLQETKRNYETLTQALHNEGGDQ
jgi:hypothetical protein